MRVYRLTIPIAPRTKKNSQRVVVGKKGRNAGRVFVLPSEAYKNYEKEAREHLPTEHINEPCNVKAIFYMDTHRRVDLVNLEEALLDTLTACGTIEDDNSLIVASMDGSRVDYCKEYPRTEIEITIE